MKKKLLFSFIAFILLGLQGLNAGNIKSSSLCIPYKAPNSILYGTDIIINNDPAQNQRNVHVAVAFNGWLFAVYTHNTSTSSGLTLLRSTDNGITWVTLVDFSYSGAYTATDIVAAGNTLADLKIFVAGILASTSGYNVWCDRIDPQTGIDESEILVEGSVNTIYDVAISSDYRYPAIGSSPYSIGIVYSKYGPVSDSVVVLTSDDGGYTIGSRYGNACYHAYAGKVAISYGISNSKYDGRYFLAWEEHESVSAVLGHIYTAYTDPWIYSPITNKIALDSLDPISTLNNCANPSIATQFNNVDNSSGNLSAVVLFDRFYVSTSDFDAIGYYNIQAVGTGITNWQRTNIAATSDNELESDINFDPAYNNFMVTYYDATTGLLPYVIHNMNMDNPLIWQVISPGYNDNNNIIDPYPKVEINPVVNQVANVWNAEGSAGGISMFDAEYSSYDGVADNHQSAQVTLHGASPNPAHTFSSIGFTLNQQMHVTITLYSIYGQEMNIVCDKNFEQGQNNVTVDVSTLPNGTYIYSFKAGDFVTSGKITVLK